MKTVVKIAKTPDEAIAEALKELGVAREQTEIDVVEETSKGLLGFLTTKSYKVTVTVKEDLGQTAGLFLRELLVNMGVPAQVEIFRKKDYTTLNINGKDLGILIGKHGQTLDAIQYLVNLAVNKNRSEKERIIIDVEGYRRRREEALRRLAVKLADKVRREGRKQVLEPMSPQERRIIHATLQGYKEVFTYSEGEDPYRHVIISPQDFEEKNPV
ncbi:spoIIIJ-associated protein [Hydrogenispora ethanolica]|uniref:RNA-binding protein KhpB n=1 Tax=Hydrogenispora ethanolica TaxID=1082276 RepID=A0A4R1SAE8_HYDET|nr:RNA-binding cell elongation regulator Jag/EloR [Hydrogenispora ethanolica]TCL76329.1 spoIIIJ-associated protein [Hydrogenispora ethanolica]